MNLLLEITILLLVAALAAPLGRYSRVGSVLAFVGAGVVVGPWGLALIGDPEDVLHFAEIGVVFLLFIIGLELQPRRLWALRLTIFGAGSAQMVATSAVLMLLLWLTGLPWQSALVIAFALALSSTAFGLRLLADNEELNARHGRLAFGVLLLQDLAVIPFLAVLPLLAPPTADAANAGAVPWWQSAGLFVLFVIAARLLLVPFLRLIAWSRVQEAFTASALLLVLGSALAMQALGLSMGLGAFVAGVLVADSEYRHQLEADIEPFKSLLLGLFFMAVGMSTNIGVLLQLPLQVIGGVLALLAIKLAVLTVLGRWFQLNNAQALRFAAYLCQGGEFAFVLFTLAGSLGIIAGAQKDLLILVVTLSMALTPLVLAIVSRCISRQAVETSELLSVLPTEEAHDIIIAGFGRFGQILGRVLNARGIHYTAIDRNAEQVQLVRRFGNKVYFGDVTRQQLLDNAHAASARVLAVCVDDVEASLAVVEMAKRHYPKLRIFARARNRFHEIRLRELGVDFVIRETLHSALVFTRGVLEGLGIGADEVDRSLATFQRHDRQLIEQQAADVNDRDSMIQSARQAADELKLLLQQDAGVTDAAQKKD